MEIFRSKPVLITEFGEPSTVRADIHSGLWAAPFFHQAGTPMLWWHEQLFLGNEGPQYPPFATYLRDLDFRGAWSAVRSMTSKIDLAGVKTLEAPEIIETDPLAAALFLHDGHAPLDIFSLDGRNGLPCLSMILPRFGAIGWIYDEKNLIKPPDDPKTAPLHSGIVVDVPRGLPPGRYRAEFYDTWAEKTVQDFEFTADDKQRKLLVPPFRLDIAFKIRRLPDAEGGGK